MPLHVIRKPINGKTLESYQIITVLNQNMTVLELAQHYTYDAPPDLKVETRSGVIQIIPSVFSLPALSGC